MIRRPPRSTLDRSSAASDVYKRQVDVGVAVIAVPTLAVELNVVVRIETPVRFASHVDRNCGALIAQGKLLRVDSVGIEASSHQGGIGHTIEPVGVDIQPKLARRGRRWKTGASRRVG